MIGSSSSSYIMLELMSIRRAPAALVLAEPDAILGLGVVVARDELRLDPRGRAPAGQQAAAHSGQRAACKQAVEF